VTPPPLKKAEVTPARQVMSTTPIIVQNATPEEIPPTQEDLSTARIGIKNIAGDNLKDDIVAPPMDGVSNGLVALPQKKADNPDSVFLKVEIESQYPGGPTAWSRFLYRKLSSGYPEEAAEKGIQGRVEIQFIVDKEGNVSNVSAVSGPDELKDVAIKVIKQSGKWIPAIQNGQKVNSYKKQPIVFAINE
jgi:periplasmic protein TonB